MNRPLRFIITSASILALSMSPAFAASGAQNNSSATKNTALDGMSPVTSSMSMPSAPTNTPPPLSQTLGSAPQLANIQSELIPAPPTINAAGYMLIDANSGKVIAEKNANHRMAPASLTKLMTLYVASSAIRSGQIKLTDEVRVASDAPKRCGSCMFLKPGQLVSVRDLIRGIIVDSGNDACVTLARHVAGTEGAFVAIMNQTAQELGMTESHFTDSTGLPNPDHYTSPRDIAILTRALIENFPQDYKWYKEKWLTFNNIRQPNRNRLLWRFDGADGLKTGHTEEAGYCLVASAERNGMRLISVVMGAPTDALRSDDSVALLTYGFRFYRTFKLYDAGSTVTTLKVWKAAHQKEDLGLANPLYITIPKGQYENLKLQVDTKQPLQGPIAQGQAIGKLVVSLKGQIVAEEPLLALSNNPRGGLWTRMSDSMSLAFHRWFGGTKEQPDAEIIHPPVKQQPDVAPGYDGTTATGMGASVGTTASAPHSLQQKQTTTTNN